MFASSNNLALAHIRERKSTVLYASIGTQSYAHHLQQRLSSEGPDQDL
jgi:hypothetical protein